MRRFAMPDEFTPDAMKQIWQTQKVEGTVMSLDEIRARARRFQRKIHMRNIREYAAAAVVVVFMTMGPLRSTPQLERVAALLCIAGVLYVVYRLHRFGSASGTPGELGLTNSLEFYRRQLERQRDLGRKV